MAAVCTTVVYPVYQFFRRKGWARISSALIVFSTLILLVIIPLFLLLNKLFFEATEVSAFLLSYAQNSADSQIQIILSNIPFINQHFPDLVQGLTLENLAMKFSDKIGEVSGSFFSMVTIFVKNISFFVLQIIIFLFAVFFFLIDGSLISDYIRRLVPLAPKQKEALFKKIYDLMRSIIFGTIGGAVAQGFLFWIGLMVVGVENPIFWAIIGAVFSPVPYVGVGIVWLPIVMSLYLNDHWGSATFLLIWCAGLVSNIDNLVKSYLIGAKSHLHPFAVMLAILGGAFSFGFQGLIFGPFVLMLLLAFLHIYELEFGEGEVTRRQKD